MGEPQPVPSDSPYTAHMKPGDMPTGEYRQVFPDGDGRMIIDHDRLAALYRLWSSKAIFPDLPDRASFAPEHFAPWMGNLSIVDYERPTQRFHIRLSGVVLTQFHGMDQTGKYLDEILSPTHRPRILQEYTAALERRGPVYSVWRGGTASRLSVHRLIMPCLAGGTDVDQLLVGLYLDGFPQMAKRIGLYRGAR